MAVRSNLLTFCTVLLASIAFTIPTLANARPPLGPQRPMVAARMDNPALSARTIIERATAAAGGETWRRPRTLYLEGYGTFYNPDGTPLINDSHRMWRIYPEFKPDAHNADGKVRIESIRAGQVVSYSAFDGVRTYGLNGVLPPSAADTQWAENFGFGVIRFALDDGYSLARQPDDLVDGTPVYRIEVTGTNSSKTLFGIARGTYQILSVGFSTPRGWHERIYSDFFTKRGINWVQPGRVRLYYNGVKQNEIVWRDFRLNAPIDDGLFGAR
jgi:hypothetical protein